MSRLLVICLLFLCIVSSTYGKDSFFDLNAVGINGKSVPLSQYKDKVVLVVNVASECGYTDNHYRGLVKLQEVFESTGKFTVLGFPCNQFGQQEPQGEPQILKFAKEKYGLNFPLFKKVNVVENDVPEYWQFLIEKSGNVPTWNFWKYLISPDGQVLNSWGPWNDVSFIYNDVKAAVDKAVALQMNEVKIEDINLDIDIGEELELEVKKHDDL